MCKHVQQYNSYNIIVHNILACISIIVYGEIHLMHHLVQTEHDNSLVLSYGGQGSDPHLPSTK